MAVFDTQTSRQAPASEVGIVHWLKENLFSSPFSAGLTILALYFLYSIIPPTLSWVFFDANFVGSAASDCTSEGACWVYIGAKIKSFIYGFYPEELYWRPNLAFAIVIGLMVIGRLLKNNPHRAKVILMMFLIYPIMAFFLLYGGLGFEVVETHKWGGLLLTLVVAAVGIVASFPIGILFALGRQSKMKVIKTLSIIYIEFIRGVPLITILFMASVVLPLFFSEGMNFDKLLRALIGITMFQTAYIAEVIRGGLQAIPKGQYEAADAAGLSFFHKMTLVILPQALKVSIPNIVGSFIALFKDTTLVLIIGLFDLLGVVHFTTSDENWLGFETEGYAFVALITWVLLYSMSLYSRALERRFSTDHK